MIVEIVLCLGLIYLFYQTFKKPEGLPPGKFKFL